MKVRCERIKYMLIHQASKFLSIYKYYLLVFFVLFLISFVTGIMTCGHYGSDITCDNLINKYLLGYLAKDTSYISFFLMLSVYFLIISLFVSVFTRNVFIVVVDIVAYCITSYILGFDVCVIVISLGLSGVIFGSLVYGLFGILIMLSLALIFSIAIRRFKESKKCRSTLPSATYIKIYLLLILISELLIFIMSIIFGIIHIFVIVE